LQNFQHFAQMWLACFNENSCEQIAIGVGQLPRI
jgi:hypothetical protein